MSIYGRPRAVYLAEDPDYKQAMLIEGFDSDLLAVIKLGGTHTPNAQIRAAIGGNTYLNAFRQRLTMLNITAIEVRELCDVQRASQAWQQLYIRYKLNGESDAPLRISCAGMVMIGRFNSVSFETVNHKGFDTLQVNFSFLCNIPTLDEVPEPPGSAADEFDDAVQAQIDEFENSLQGRIDSFTGSVSSPSSSSTAEQGVLYGGAEILVNTTDSFGNITGSTPGFGVGSIYVPPNYRRNEASQRVFGSNALS
jgi:hypothetical protein